MMDFIHVLNRVGQWLFENLWQLSVELAVLAAVVAIVIALLRVKSPAMRGAFWFLVLLKPVATLLIASPISLYWYLQPLPPPQPVVVAARPARVAAPRPQFTPPRRMPAGRPARVSTNTPPPPVPPAWKQLDRYGVLAGAWIVIAAGFAIRLIAGFAYVCFLRNTADPQRAGPLCDCLAQAVRAVRMRHRVRVAISDRAKGPVLTGVLRPMILLPRRLADELPPERLTLILAHELAHVRRWDNAVLLIQRLAEMFLFFHPAVWLCGWAMRREAETACDDVVISAFGNSAEYADSLTRAAESRAGLAGRVLVNTFAAAESGFSRRVRRVLRGPAGKTTLGLTVASIVALIVIGCLGLPSASQRKAASETKTKEETSMTSKSSARPKTPEQLAARVQREGSRVWIEGVPDGRFDIHWDMLTRAMETLLTYRDENVTRTELLAYSGDAFNLCHGSHWQGMASLSIPTDPVGNLARAYGYEYECVHDGWSFEKMDRLKRPERVELTRKTLERVYAEIDAGRPALVGGTEDHCGSWTLAVGYDRENLQLCHIGENGQHLPPYRWSLIRGIAPGSTDEKLGHWNGRYRGTIRENFVGCWQSNPTYLIKDKKADAPTPRDRDLRALQLAVEIHAAPKHSVGYCGGVDFFFGAEAYRQWAGELGELDYPADLEKPQPKGAFDWYAMGNMDMQVDQIVVGRTAAAAFCQAAASRLPKGREDLLAAAALYRQEVDIAKSAFAAFIPRFDGNDEPRKAWLSDESKREAGVKAIDQMLEKDRAAVAAIQKALAAEGVAVSAGANGAASGPPVAQADEAPKTAGDLRDNVRREEGRAWLEGLRHSDLNMQQPGNLVACARYLGYDESDAWLCGAMGFAFAMNVGDDLCPSGPSAWADHKLLPLGADAGLPIETFHGAQSQPDFPDLQKKAFARAQAVIDAGLPVIGNNMVVPEAYLVVGYDEAGNYLFVNFEGDRAKISKRHHSELDFLWFQFPTLKPPADDRLVVRKAIVTALKLAEGKNFDSSGIGLRAYDNWIKGVTASQDGKFGFGAGYNAACWAECRRFALAFLKEAKTRVADEKLDPLFDEAIGHYGIVAASLDEVANQFPLAFGDDEAMVARLKDPSRRTKALAALTEARAAEAQGLKTLAAIAVALGAEGIDPDKLDLPTPPDTSAEGGNTTSTETGEAKVANQIDYSKLELKGNGHEQDSFSLALVAATKLLGKDADYESVYCLSSNAFAPAIDAGESCAAWWHMYGGDSGLDILSGRLGLKVAPFDIPAGDFTPTPEDSQEDFGRKIVAQRKAAAPVLQKAMNEGHVLLTVNGWQVRTERGLVPWCWWGIITEARDDGTILGAQMNGYRDNPLDFVGKCYAVYPAEPALGPHEADMKMLQRAVERIRGRKPEPHGDKLRLGLDAMDVWIAQMGKVPFCPDCNDKSWTCAINNSQTTSAGATAAASYLRKCKSAFSPQAQEHIETAAACYDRIVKLLAPSMTGQGGPHCRDFVGDPEKQKAHVETVLKPVKAELAAAAEAMEKALAAEGVDVPAAGGDKYPQVVVEAAVKEFNAVPERLRSMRSYSLMHAVAMRASGLDNVDPETVDVLTGFAGSFSYHPQKAWAGYFAPPGGDERVRMATGWGLQWQQAGDAEKAWEIIRSEIDAGRCVRAPWTEEAIFAGYQDADDKAQRQVLVMCFPFANPPKWWTWQQLEEWQKSDHSGHGWLTLQVTGGKPEEPRAVALAAIRAIVQCAKSDPRAGNPVLAEVKWGLAGIEAYAADIADTDKTLDYFDSGWFGCYAVIPQRCGRRHVAGYLDKLAASGVLNELAGSHVAAAAKAYRQAADAWDEYDKQLGLGQKDKKNRCWDVPANRTAGAAAVRQALQHERVGVSELEKAIGDAGSANPGDG